MSNPLLAAWDGAFGLPPFGAIRDADFGPAFAAALAEARANIAAIAGQGLRGRLLLFDGLYGESRMIAVEPRADCAGKDREG